MLLPTAAAAPAFAGVTSGAAPRLSVVVPCHNEAESLPQLAASLVRLRAALPAGESVEFLLVDDGSTDATWTLLHDYLGAQADVRLLRHPANRGIAAAIGTGLREARAEVVASLDADCTYDPQQLLPMLRLLTDGVDLVVASPYHPQGGVEGVPAWRLALSRGASRLYRLLLRNQLHTYTSCVRVYRRSAIGRLPEVQGGFVGIVELLWQLDRHGGRIVECPAVLTTRKTGVSKLRVARTAGAHLWLMARIAGRKSLETCKRLVARPMAAAALLPVETLPS